MYGGRVINYKEQQYYSELLRIKLSKLNIENGEIFIFKGFLGDYKISFNGFYLYWHKDNDNKILIDEINNIIDIVDGKVVKI